MKFCEFLAIKKTGFHLAKITPDDVRSEDVLELIGTVVKDIPVFIFLTISINIEVWQLLPIISTLT